MVFKDCTVDLSSHVSVSLSTVECTLDCTTPSNPFYLATMQVYSSPLFLAGPLQLLLVLCLTQLTPFVVVWWWHLDKLSNTRTPWTALFKSWRTKDSCPWWRELVSKIIVYGLTKLFHHFFHEIFLFTFCEVFYKVKVFTRNMKHLTCSWHAFTNFEKNFLKNFDVFF